MSIQMETMYGTLRFVSLADLRKMRKADLLEHLEARGFDPYGWTVAEMREVAIDDYREESK